MTHLGETLLVDLHQAIQVGLVREAVDQEPGPVLHVEPPAQDPEDGQTQQVGVRPWG